MNKFIFSILALIFLTQHLLADRRNYIWTYQYTTMPQGMTELEFYQTTRLADTDFWEYRIEVEQGLTNRMDISVYQIFSQFEDAPFQWDAVQLRTRYRFGETGSYFMDPLIYLEYRRNLDFSDPNKLELKFVLAKQMNAVNLALNPVYEIYFAPGVEHETGLDAGISYEISPRLVIGAESTSRIEFEDSKTEIGSYLGPTISLASGQWWYTFGAAFGITEDSDNARVRFIMGVHL
ncbi:MAG: hypothetical protein P8Y99_15140 [Calditrichaceae bacterium]